MKKVNLKGKLSLKKETIVKLNASEMQKIKAGTFCSVGCPFSISCTSNCTAASCTC